MADTAPLPSSQVIALVECMLSTAQIDGVQPKELTLLRGFYEAQSLPGMPTFDEVVANAGKDPALLGSVRSDAAFVEQLVMMCLVTGYADGRLSEAERQHALAIAKQLGVDDARFAELQTEVKDSLIGTLAHLPDPESVAALAKTM